MKIECYLSAGCGSEDALRRNIGLALELEGISAEVEFHTANEEKTLELGLTGSPSVFIGGRQLQPQGAVGFS